MSNFASSAEKILGARHSAAAAELLSDGDLEGAEQGQLDRVVQLAISSADAAGFYQRVIGLVSPEVQQEMNADVGTNSEPEIVVSVMQDESAAPHRDAIMAAFVESADGDAIASVFAETASLVSENVRGDMVKQLAESGTDVDELIGVLMDEDAVPYLKEIAAAIAEDGEWDNDDLSQMITEAGHCLDDDTIVLIARAMQNEVREADADEESDDVA